MQCLECSCLRKTLPRCLLSYQAYIRSSDWLLSRHFRAAIRKPSSYALTCFEAAPSWMPPQLDNQRNLTDRPACLCVEATPWDKGRPAGNTL